VIASTREHGTQMLTMLLYRFKCLITEYLQLYLIIPH